MLTSRHLLSFFRVAVGTILITTTANAGWFSTDSSKQANIRIEDGAYLQLGTASGRPSFTGVEQTAELVSSADQSILKINLTRRRLNGFLDQFQQGLLKPQEDGQRYELAYDAMTGFLSFQTMTQVKDPTAVIPSSLGPTLNNTDAVTLLVVNDVVTRDFLGAVVHNLYLVSKAASNSADCNSAEGLKRAVPLESFLSVFPPDRILFGRRLKPVEGCEQTWQQFQWAVLEVIDLVYPANAGSGTQLSPNCMNGGLVVSPCRIGEGSYTAVYKGSPVGRVPAAIANKITVVAKTGLFQPINHDLASNVQTFEVDPKNQWLQIKRKRQYVFEDERRGQPTEQQKYRLLPIYWDSEASLRQLRSETFDRYRQPTAVQ